MSDSTLTGTSGAALTPLQQLIEMGGPVMLVLIGLAIAGLIAFFYLVLSGTVFAPRLTRRLRSALAQWQQQPDRQTPEQIAEASGWLARANPLSPLMAYAMTARLDRLDPAALREELARRCRKALQPFEAPLKIIEVIAALAPLLGLLGTVMGMMAAFSAMATATGQAGASELSGGIYEALTTTAAGLVIAIPFAALAAWIEFRLGRLNTMLNDVLVRVISTPLPAPEIAAHEAATHPMSAPLQISGEPPAYTHRVAHAAG
ncbi:MotA/TolQ/ExbB proton channel family protein [Marinobacter changyiensis]|uniref:MotA/TolQ/ExbB proton channel family protein n=1 Tax=Marinobacter changyiensis TaxID=2604091 RepID=UPI001264ED44|nr:MotA/TolQ/ExbB proton channel family protein [Marinobacter changyiensis]